MSRIDDLIKKHCPDGVELASLSDITLKTENIRWGDNIDCEFQYIDLTSVDRITRTIAETSTITEKNAPSRAQQIVREGDVIFGTTRPMLKRYAVIPNEYDGQICSTGFCVLRPNIKVVLTNFLYHMLGTLDFYTYVEKNERGASYPAIPDRLVKEFKIPLPPLPVQQEIVDILDAFTKLEAELEAELEARRQQYAHYRNSLLSFNEIGRNVERESCFVQWRSLGEIGMFIRGNGLQKKDFTETGVGCIHYGQLYTHYGIYADKTKTFISDAFAKKLRKAKKGNLVIATTSENDEDVCKAVAWLGDEDIAVSGDAYIYQHSLHPKYVAYFFLTDDFQKQKRQYITGTKVRRVSGDSMSKIKIPVPSPEEQERIVAILDKFDALVNDISSGLPAEITARRQQYAHYRNQLLTFKEAA